MQSDIYWFNVAMADKWRANVFAFIREDEAKRQARPWKDKINEMLILPGELPIAQPSALLWDMILDENFSETRLNALFREDAMKRSQAKDLMGELLASGEYGEWLDRMKLDPKTHPLRREYYTHLGKEVWMDHDTVSTEWHRLFEMATEVGRFEYQWLDKDGKTTWIERKLRTGELQLGVPTDLREERLKLETGQMMAKKWGKAVEDKHKHLRPTAYEGTGVGMFECRYCPDTDKGMETTLSSLKKGDEIFQGYGEEVKKKYRHLATFEFTPLGFWQQLHLDDDGGTTKIESTLLNMGTRPIFKFFDPFPGAPREAWEKYARLIDRKSVV